MDNETYLQQLAAQARPLAPKSRIFNFLTPTAAKIIAAGLITLTLIITIAIVINTITGQSTTLYERYYLRLQNLSSQSGPLAAYGTTLKSSDLRSLAGDLRTSLSVTSRDFNNLLPDLRVNTANIGPKATDEEAANLASYDATLRDAQLNGLLDRSFASSTTLQISLLLSLQAEIRHKSSNPTLLTILDRSDSDLQALLTKFTDFSNAPSTRQ